MSNIMVKSFFCFQMRENYVNLKKAFMSFDRFLDGFIAIEDLQSILTQFTIPMSKQLFCQLMEKYVASM